MKKNGIGQTIRMPLLYRHRKILNVMKWNILFVFFFCMNLSANSFSQNVKVSLDLEQVSVKEFLRTVQEQTGINFLYNANLIEGIDRVSVHVTDRELRLVLQDILKPKGLEFIFQEGTVIIKKVEEKKEPIQKIVVGTVWDENKNPLPGVTVTLKGLNVGTATDSRGFYKMYMLDTTKNATLVFSFVGMETHEVRYRGQDTINVVLTEDMKQMDEVVVTGYQTLKKRSQAGSISSVKAEDLLLNGTQSLEQALQGKIPGMMIMNRSGLTGTRQRVRVRGTSTLLGNAEPVWVVDGVIQMDPLPFETNDLNNIDLDSQDMIRTFVGSAISWLNPNDIETVTVLKDAASTAIYGTKAANGVIVITTKKGKVGRMSVSYSGNFSLTPRMTYNKLEVMNSKQRVDVSREAYQHGLLLEGNQDIGYTALAKAYRRREISLDEFRSEAAKLETNNTDWFDILFRNAFSHNHSIGISGGTEQATYHASFGISQVYNTAVGNEQTQYTGNVSVSANLWKSVSLSTNLSGSVSDTKGFVGTDPFSYATSINRAIPAYNEDGSRFFYKDATKKGYLFNVENELDYSGNENSVTSLNASVNLRWRITGDISFDTSVSYSRSETNGESWYTERTNYIAQIRRYDFGAFEVGSEEFLNSELPNGGEYNNSRNTASTWSWRNSLDWTKVLNGVHSITFMLGQEISSAKNNGMSFQAYGYIPDKGKIFVNLPAYTQHETWDPPVNGKHRTVPRLQESETNSLSYYATLSYMYDNRYAFNASVRADGNNRFGQDKKKRFLPVWAFGARWNVGYEPWLQGQDILSDMSLRVSYGYQGNVAENVSPELIATIVEDEENYDYKLQLKDLPAPDLKWEKTSNLNVGIDWSLFKNKFSGSFEWYWKKTEDLITDFKVPYEHGVDSRPVNNGSMTNTGWDASVGFTPVRTKDFVLSMGLTFSGVNNKVNSTIEPTKTWKDATSGNLNKDGYPVTSFWAFRFTGLNSEHGGPEFDLEGWDTDEGLKDATVYMEYAGKMEPDFTTGLSFSIRYKTFSLSSGLYLSLGNQQFMAPPMTSFESIPSEYENMSTEWVKRWKKPGDEKHTNIPSLPDKRTSAVVFQAPNGDLLSPYELYAYSTIRVVDAWYIRCNSISCSYSMPEKFLPRGLQNLGFSFSISNPFQIRSKDFKGRDPEVALGSQPLQRTVSFGVSMSF